MKKLVNIGLVCISFITLSTQASVLYQSAGFSNLSTPLTNAWCSSCGGSSRVYDQFTLGAASSVVGTDVGVQSDFGKNWNIDVQIWSGDLSALIYDGAYAPGSYTVNPLAGDVSEVSIDFTSAIDLGAGTYYMSWFDPNGLGIPGYAGGNTALQGNPDPVGANGLGQVAGFDVLGSNTNVPEPATIALLGLGLTGLSLARRRKL